MLKKDIIDHIKIYYYYYKYKYDKHYYLKYGYQNRCVKYEDSEVFDKVEYYSQKHFKNQPTTLETILGKKSRPLKSLNKKELFKIFH